MYTELRVRPGTQASVLKELQAFWCEGPALGVIDGAKFQFETRKLRAWDLLGPPLWNASVGSRGYLGVKIFDETGPMVWNPNLESSHSQASLLALPSPRCKSPQAPFLTKSGILQGSTGHTVLVRKRDVRSASQYATRFVKGMT